MTRWTIDPESLGVRGVTAGELVGGEPAENAAIIERILVGKGSPGAEAAVLLNAAAAIVVAGLAPTLPEGMTAARAALAAGKGWDALGRLRRASAVR